jgi:hypothetical protein
LQSGCQLTRRTNFPMDFDHQILSGFPFQPRREPAILLHGFKQLLNGA